MAPSFSMAASAVDDAWFAVKAVETTHPVRRVVALRCQNENGPCPLLAVVNALEFKSELGRAGDENDASDATRASTPASLRETMSRVMEHMLVRAEAMAKREDVDEETVRMTLDDATATLERSAKGVDVNVRFDACESFEYTKEMTMFDLCGLRLVHGWVVGEVEHGAETARLCSSVGYNGLVERLIDLRTTASGEGTREGREEGNGETRTLEASVSGASAGEAREGETSGEREERELLERAMRLSMEDSRDAKLARAMHEADLIETFLNDTASQLTLTGLAQIRERIQEREYAVLFRNNHFSVITKVDGELYALVTDSGYQDEPDVVWEVLGGARDGTFANSEFRPFEPRAEGAGAASPTTQTASALPDTFLRAAPSTTEPASSPTSDEKSDYAVALELQAQFEEEERLALRAAERRVAERRAEARAAQSQPAPPASSRPTTRGARKPKPKKSSSSVADSCAIM